MSHTQPEFCYTFRDFDGVFKIGEGIELYRDIFQGQCK